MVQGFRRLLLVTGIVSVSLITVLLGVVYAGLSPPIERACGPSLYVDHQFDSDADQLVITYIGGRPLEGDGRTVVTVTDAETNQTATVVWLRWRANTTVEPRDTIRIGEAGQTNGSTVPFELGPDDRVRLLWQPPLMDTLPPKRCPSSIDKKEFTIGK